MRTKLIAARIATGAGCAMAIARGDIANPIAALHEWKRVLKPGASMLLVAPHRIGTFDWKRPVTSLAHLREDFARSTPETDLTHLPEILSLHDLTRDLPAGDLTRFEARCRKNFENRGMHHHVFDTSALIDLIEEAGFEVSDVFTSQPFHIAVVARNVSQPLPISVKQRATWLAESDFESAEG
jgi:SAM-dependent methyltransferase